MAQQCRLAREHVPVWSASEPVGADLQGARATDQGKLEHSTPLLHLTPPPASITVRCRNETKSQTCGSREVVTRTQQSGNVCKKVSAGSVNVMPPHQS